MLTFYSPALTRLLQASHKIVLRETTVLHGALLLQLEALQSSFTVLQTQAQTILAAQSEPLMKTQSPARTVRRQKPPVSNKSILQALASPSASTAVPLAQRHPNLVNASSDKRPSWDASTRPTRSASAIPTHDSPSARRPPSRTSQDPLSPSRSRPSSRGVTELSRSIPRRSLGPQPQTPSRARTPLGRASIGTPVLAHTATHPAAPFSFLTQDPATHRASPAQAPSTPSSIAIGTPSQTERRRSLIPRRSISSLNASTTSNLLAEPNTPSRARTTTPSSMARLPSIPRSGPSSAKASTEALETLLHETCARHDLACRRLDAEQALYSLCGRDIRCKLQQVGTTGSRQRIVVQEVDQSAKGWKELNAWLSS